MNNKKLIEPMIPINKKPSQNNKYVSGMIFEEKTKSVEDKLYIILYYIIHDDEDNFEGEEYKQLFSIHIGRTEAYNDIKNKLTSGYDIDIHRSKIITETKQTETSTGNQKYYLLPFNECISIYSFCTSLSEYYSLDEFDIEDYNDTVVPESGTVNVLQDLPNYVTPEQAEYRKLLDAQIKREKFLDNLSSISFSDNNGVDI